MIPPRTAIKPPLLKLAEGDASAPFLTQGDCAAMLDRLGLECRWNHRLQRYQVGRWHGPLCDLRFQSTHIVFVGDWLLGQING